MQLQQAIDAYIENLISEGKDKKTVNAYRGDLGIASGFLGDQKPLGEITVQQVGKFLRSETLHQRLDGVPRVENTVQRIQRVLRMMFCWACEQGCLEVPPIPKSLPMGRSKLPDSLVWRGKE